MAYRDFSNRYGCFGFSKLCRVAAVLSVTAALGTVAWAAADTAIGDARDAMVITPILTNALENEPSGKDIPWSNTATGHTGTIRIERTYYRGQQPCRNYMRKTSGSGTEYEVRGIGCRLGKMNWETEETKLDAPVARSGYPVPDPATKKPTDPDGKTAAGDTGGTDAPRDATPPRPPRKAPPPQPALQYSLPTRSQL